MNDDNEYDDSGGDMGVQVVVVLAIDEVLSVVEAHGD